MYPIKTFINNNVVVKICTEDIHKLVDLIHDTAEDVHDNIHIMLDHDNRETLRQKRTDKLHQMF